MYYSEEVDHEPVFVKTSQPEFNYPSGSQNVQTTYHGDGGFSISSPLLRLAAAVHYADGNILLTEYLNDKSRMMIHRTILERLETIAGFLTWDQRSLPGCDQGRATGVDGGRLHVFGISSLFA